MEALIVLLGAIFGISTAIILALQKERRGIILERLRFRQRKNSGSKTPPQTLSPEKKKSFQNVSTPDYSTTFPPSRRSALAENRLKASLLEAVAAPRTDRIGRMLPMEISYLEATDDMLTPCKISVKEVKALGNFPDYASLSGVPLPQPYHDFDIRKA